MLNKEEQELNEEQTIAVNGKKIVFRFNTIKLADEEDDEGNLHIAWSYDIISGCDKENPPKEFIVLAEELLNKHVNDLLEKYLRADKLTKITNLIKE